MSLSKIYNEVLAKGGWLASVVRANDTGVPSEDVQTGAFGAVLDRRIHDAQTNTFKYLEDDRCRSDRDLPDLKTSSDGKGSELVPAPELNWSEKKLANCLPRVDPPVRETGRPRLSRLAFIELEDEIKITFSPCDIPGEQHHSFLWSLHKPFYPDLARENISTMETSLNPRLLDHLLADGFVKRQEHKNLDQLRSKIERLAELDLYFELSTTFLEPSKNTAFDSQKVGGYRQGPTEWVPEIEPSKATGVLPANLGEFARILSPDDPESFLTAPKTLPFSQIESARLYFFYNRQTFRGHLLTDRMEEFPLDLSCRTETEINQTLKEHLPEVTLVRIVPIDEGALFERLEDYRSHFNQIFSNLETFSNQVIQLSESLERKSSGFTTPNCSELKEYLVEHYQLSQNVDHRVKFTDLFNQLCEQMSIHQDHHKFVKTLLPPILKELKLEKKRYSDGMYWYGIRQDLKKSIRADQPDQTNEDSAGVIDRFEKLKGRYTKKANDLIVKIQPPPDIRKPIAKRGKTKMRLQKSTSSSK
jgi:hypothetical protein